jgi:hypothetical protein
MINERKNPYGDRITEILQSRANQMAQSDYAPGEFLQPGESAYYGLRAALGNEPDGVLQAIRGVQDQRRGRLMEEQNMQLGAQRDLYSLFEEQKAAGNKQAEALLNKIDMFTDGDPEGAQIFLQSLNDDPEEIDPTNAYQVMTKLAQIKKQSGYKSPSEVMQGLQKQTAQTRLSIENERLKQTRSAPPIAGGSGGSKIAAGDMGPPSPNQPTIPTAKAPGGTGSERMLSRYTELEGKRRQSGLTMDEQIEHQALQNEIDPAARETSKARGKAEAKVIQGINENALQSGPALEQLTGVEAAVDELGSLKQGPFIGMLPNVTTAAQTLDAQSTKDALAFVNQTKGAVSDREMTMFKQASIGTNKNMQFNKNYIQAARSALVRQQQQQQFFNAYNEAYGTLEGSYEAFKKFADDNPIFEWDGTNIVTLKTPDQVANDDSYLNYISKAPKATQERTQKIFDLQTNTNNQDDFQNLIDMYAQ